jgi:hypothetical protein
MSTRRLLTVVVLFAVLVVPAPVFAAKKPVVKSSTDLAADVKEWTGTLPEGQTFEIKWVYGDVLVSDSEDDKIHLAIDLRPGESNPVFQLLEHDQGLTLCAVYAANKCEPGDRGSLFRGVKQKKSGRTNLTVSLPTTVKFAGRAAEGTVVSKFNGAAVFDVMTSSMFLTSGTNVEAENVSGTIKVTLNPSPVRRRFWVMAMNDKADVTLNNVPVKLKVKGDPSRIRSHVPVETSLEMGTAVEAEGANYKGEGAVVDLEVRTMNGEIIIRRE